MAKVTYASLKLKTNTDVVSFDYNGNTIEVLQYLPIEEKYDLVMVAAQHSLESGIYNPVKLDMFFHLYLVYMYANISFTEKQRENESKLYDTLKSTGLMDEILKNIPETEYNALLQHLEEYIKIMGKYNKSIVSLFKSLINDLPTQAEAAAKIIDNFNPEKFKEVVEFAKAANGGRDIQ